jgi:hypothetical protein
MVLEQIALLLPVLRLLVRLIAGFVRDLHETSARQHRMRLVL